MKDILLPPLPFSSPSHSGQDLPVQRPRRAGQWQHSVYFLCVGGAFLLSFIVLRCLILTAQFIGRLFVPRSVGG